MTRARRDLLLSGFYRAIRTFVQAYIGVIIAAWLALDDSTISNLWNVVEVHSDRAAGVGLIAALTAFGWRTVLDPAPVPSLQDPPPDQADEVRRT